MEKEILAMVRAYGVGWKKGKKLKPSLAIRFALQALNGLVYARKAINHDLGVAFIHGDIKPEDLPITAESTVKVTDFSLVMARGGTRTYMP
jgi:serine/threonine protein kinase